MENNLLRINHYKEKKPMDTVNHLRKILNNLGIKTNERWLCKDDDICQSLRLTIEGTDIGTNGKGISKEYALASAYGEFFERLQNSILAYSTKLDYATILNGEFIDEVNISAEEIIEENSPFIKMLIKKLGLCEDDIILCSLQLLTSISCDLDNNKFWCKPYYSVNEKKVFHIPRQLSYLYYSSNGMCTGNTPEEALVQGMSEIIERYVQKKVIEEQLSLPDIPMEYIKTFPAVYEVYQKLLHTKPSDYEYILKDASLGGKYPVAVFIAINKNTHTCGIRFGAHPDYGIAIERTLTEALQGRNMERFSQGTILDFSNNGVQDEINIYNSFKAGIAQYPVEILSKNFDFDFIPTKNISNRTNKQMLNDMINLFKDMGSDILIRDVSYLGIFSYHIIVPNISEITTVSEKSMRLYNTIKKSVSILKNLSEASDKDLEIVRIYEDYIKYSHYENNLNVQIGIPLSYSFFGDENGLGSLILSSMICYKLKQYDKAKIRIQEYNHIIKSLKNSNYDFYKAMEEYIKGKEKNISHTNIMQILRLFYNKSICDKVEKILKDEENVLKVLYPQIKQYECENCNLKQYCNYQLISNIQDKLIKMQKKYFPKQQDIEKIVN